MVIRWWLNSDLLGFEGDLIMIYWGLMELDGTFDGDSRGLMVIGW